MDIEKSHFSAKATVVARGFHFLGFLPTFDQWCLFPWCSSFAKNRFNSRWKEWFFMFMSCFSSFLFHPPSPLIPYSSGRIRLGPNLITGGARTSESTNLYGLGFYDSLPLPLPSDMCVCSLHWLLTCGLYHALVEIVEILLDMLGIIWLSFSLTGSSCTFPCHSWIGWRNTLNIDGRGWGLWVAD